MELIKKFYADRDKYRIDIVLVPSPGEPKEELRRLWCSKEKRKNKQPRYSSLANGKQIRH